MLACVKLEMLEELRGKRNFRKRRLIPYTFFYNVALRFAGRAVRKKKMDQ
jgi:hypothetical protein